MIICNDCGLHRFNDNTACPHCIALPCRNSGRTQRMGIALLMGFTAIGCGDKDNDSGLDTGESVVQSEPGSEPPYGVPELDADGDGFYADQDDCDDSDPDINPDAEEIPGDGIDSNCNGEDDT